MLFDKTDKSAMRHQLTDLMQNIITAMRILEVDSTSSDAAHKELYNAMEKLVDMDVASSYEYQFMLDVSCRKARSISAGNPSMATDNEIYQ